MRGSRWGSGPETGIVATVTHPDEPGKLSPDEDVEFWVFYRKTSEALFRRAYRMCDGHHADADDAVQRTYLRALDHWSTVSGLADQQRSAWLATTLAREVLQIWRAPHRSRETQQLDDATERLGDADGPDAVSEADPSSMVVDAIVVRNLLASLPRAQQEAMWLRTEGFSYAEIAKMVGLSAPAVRKQAQRARDTLKQRLKDQAWVSLGQSAEEDCS